MPEDMKIGKMAAIHLARKILPFWEKLKDEKYGGFYGYVDKELNVRKDADKGCILHGRILWTFATAARVLEGNPTLLKNANTCPDGTENTGVLKTETLREYADWAYESLRMFEDPENGGVYWSITHDGKPSDTTKHTYCQAFVIYGLSAYYRLTGKREALEKARKLFRIIEDKCTVYNGYGEAYQADFKPESNEKLSENGVMATRTMNTLLHVLEGYTELYRAEPSEEVRQRGEEALERFLHTMYNPSKHRLDVFYDDEYHPLLDMQSYGHDIEAGWLLWDSVTALLPEEKWPPYKAMCVDLLESVYSRAFTDHGLRNECVDGVNDELRIWWVQAETMLGLAMAYHLTADHPDPKWTAALQTQWDTIERMIVDKRENGEWYWSVYEDGSLTERPMVEEWKCPYHNGRMCLRLMEDDLPV